jgi:hypothetical protein
VERIEALHTAARRYCVERSATWEDRYVELLADEERARVQAGVPKPIVYSYSPEALETFPRYNILRAIQDAVEVFTPADFNSLDEARELLAAAAASVESKLMPSPAGPIEECAMKEERGLFADYVREVSDERLASVEPLPFRRTLRAEESARLWAELERRWGIKGYWYPLDRAPDAEPPPDAVAFAAEPFFDDDLQRRLRSVLGGFGVSHLWELREPGPESDHELELELLEPVYTGSEGFWADDSFEWLVYASHELSVTIVGAKLLPALQETWPSWARHLYSA